MPRVDDLPLDTSLLRAFDALLQERNVTRAARRLGVTQPALSRSLARLRRAFGDPLFVRTRSEMVATPRAEALASRVRHLLEELKGLTREQGPFVPSEARRRFTLYTSDYAQCVILPPLVAALARSAPGIALDALPWHQDFLPTLESGAVDLVVAPSLFELRSVYVKKLLTERFVCIVRDEHPLVGDTLPLPLFTRLEHAVIAPGGRPGSLVDEALLHGDPGHTWLRQELSAVCQRLTV